MQSIYYELSIYPSCEPELLSEFIETIYTHGLEIDEKSIIIRDENPLTSLQEEIESFCSSIAVKVRFQHLKKQNSDWIKKYQDSIEPIEIEKFYIRPSWHATRKDLIDIIIDPALSFGSGHHATTQSCIKAISRYCKSGDTVLDVGCGSGILSIAAAKLGAVVDICDSDEQAVESSLSNFKQNSLYPHRHWIGSVNKTDVKYDIVVANIVADILIMLKNELEDRVCENGILILSGIIDSKVQEIKENFNRLQLIETIEKDEWTTLVYRGVNEKL